MKNNIDFLLSAPIAHRGLHGGSTPENSLKAFKLARDKGFLIELDVHLLSDGELVVFHDDNTKRMTGVDVQTKDLTVDELKRLRLKNTRQHIPLLREVLDLIDGAVPIIIEVKNDCPAKEICPVLIKIMSDYRGQFAVKSFDPRIVQYFKKHAPYIGRGQLATNNNYCLKNLWLNFWTKPDFISYDIRSLPNKRIEKIRHKMPILGWTVRSRQDLAIAKKYCDNYICENILS